MNCNKSFSCLIIGLGQIGMGYDYSLTSNFISSHARAFALHDNFNLIGAVDPDIEKCKLFKDKYKQPTYRTIHEAFSVNQPDVVIIAVPTSEHFSIIKDVLTFSNPIAILCEKPLAYSLEEASRMINLCISSSVELFVNYIRRSVPGAIEVKKRLDKCEITKPVRGVVWYSKGFLHNASHFFNLMEYWLGHYNRASIIDSGRLLDNEDSEPHVVCDFKEGSVTFIPVWEEYYSHYSIELLSPKGRLYWKKDRLSWQSIEIDQLKPDYKRLSDAAEIIPTGIEQYQWHVADQLAKRLHHQPASICTAAQALTTLKSMTDIIR